MAPPVLAEKNAELKQANHSALLVMDVQNGIVQRFAEKPEVMIPFQRAVSAARRAEIPVIFVRVAFRDGYPELSAKNKNVFGSHKTWEYDNFRYFNANSFFGGTAS